MWRNIRTLCCPKNTENTINSSNLGHLDQCFGCKLQDKCLANINKYYNEEE